MITGGCFCGAATYKIEGTLCKARACHCSKCRKVFSGAGSVYAELGEAAKFQWVSGEQEVSRYSSMPGWELLFCATCGTSLCGVFDGAVHGVALGTVNGDPGVAIEMHFFVGSKAPWDHIGGTAPQYEEGPPNDWLSGKVDFRDI